MSFENERRLLRFESIDDVRGAIKDADAEFIPIGDCVKGQALTLKVDDVLFSSTVFAGGLRTRGTQLDHFSIGIQIRRAGLVSQWDLELEPGDVVVMPPGIERDGCSVGEAHFAMVSLYSGTLSALGGPDVTMKELWLAKRPLRYRPEPSVAKQVVRAVSNLSQLSRDWRPTSRTQVELMKRRLLIPYLLGLSSGTQRPAEACLASSPSIVRQAEDWLDTAEPERLNVVDLCHALGMPLRSVQRAFHAHVGMGPTSYLRRRRLLLARRALLLASPDAASVTQIALDHGFWDLGRFAVTYHRVFGEKPSTTLRRIPTRAGRRSEIGHDRIR